MSTGPGEPLDYQEGDMDQQQHMTKTEAHPYHHGRECKVFDPNCPLCRDDPKRETTYVSWSLHQTALDKIKAFEELLTACKEAEGFIEQERDEFIRDNTGPDGLDKEAEGAVAEYEEALYTLGQAIAMAEGKGVA